MTREEILKNIILFYKGSVDFNFYWNYYNKYKKVDMEKEIFFQFFPIYYTNYSIEIIRYLEAKYNIIKTIYKNEIIDIK